jgi:hypothetical protein
VNFFDWFKGKHKRGQNIDDFVKVMKPQYTTYSHGILTKAQTYFQKNFFKRIILQSLPPKNGFLAQDGILLKDTTVRKTSILVSSTFWTCTKRNMI